MPATTSTKAASLETAYDTLHQLLSRRSPPLKSKTGTVRGKRDFHLVIPNPMVVPGAYGGKPVEIDLASLILQKDYVGFYFMPIYIEPNLKKKLSPSLTKLLQGKTCFHIKRLDDDLLKHVEAALDEGVKFYKGRGWL